jgi:outer membrane lipoprotein-sorting protein
LSARSVSNYDGFRVSRETATAPIERAGHLLRLCALAGLLSATASPSRPAAGVVGNCEAVPLTAEQIVANNVAARGGLEAWRKIQTMVWTGHIESGNASAASVQFILEYKRPNKMRFEIDAEHEKSVRVFDGTAGWQMLTSSSGTPRLKRYSRRDLRSARDAQGIGGLLIDYQAHGITVALDSTDEVEGQRAYRLAVTLPSGSTRHIWIDAQTFLDLKYDREGHLANGHTGTISVFYRDYRTIDGVRMPMTIETIAQGGRATERVVVEWVTLNPSLSDAHFERPGLPEPRHRKRDLRTASQGTTQSVSAITPPGVDASRTMYPPLDAKR